MKPECKPGANGFSVKNRRSIRVQKLAGHSNIQLTMQTYAHVQAEALRRAAGVQDRIGMEGKVAEGADQLHPEAI